jgi:hypothetical protein
MMAVNGQFPGPTISASKFFRIILQHRFWMINFDPDWGDMLQITVKNSLQDNGQVYFQVYAFR